MNQTDNLWSRVIEQQIDASRLDDLRAAAGDGPVLILTHENPDPDALAAGKTLATLLEKAWNIQSHPVFSGLVARAENQAMLRILTPEWELVESLPDLNNYSATALVDTQPGAGNNRLPNNHTPQIVFDHHYPIHATLAYVSFYEVRPEIGATTSLVYKYLEAAGVQPDPALATAIFYGIQTDTRALSRNASALDQYIYFQLLTRLDRPKLVQIEQASLPRLYFRAISDGLKAAQIFGNTVVVYLGEIHRPDFAAEMADLLIRVKDSIAALCLGYHNNHLYLSLRTESSLQDAGILIQQVIGSLGKAGGHGTIAGGSVNLEARDISDVVEQITARFLKVMNANVPGEALI